MKKFSAFLIVFLFFTALLAGESNVTTIKILNAQKTEYKKSEETGNESIFLEGSVEISVTKDKTTTTVSASKITFDRQTKIMYAEGNVKLTSDGEGGGIDDASADSLILNTQTMEGIFDDGRVVQTKSESISLPSGSVLVVFSEIFGKTENNTIAFKNASLTFCDDLNPHWHIKASRIWLLPGGEFAFLNALLYVGPVPVMYFPAFYYPKDELVFNPSIGFKKREGYFVQTTTYVYGRKPLSSDTSLSQSQSDDSKEALKSLYNFMKPSSLKEQRHEGLMLRNLDEPYKGDTSKYIKIMADWYSNLGLFTGVSGNLIPNEKIFSKLAFEADFGFSNEINSDVSGYTKVNRNGIIIKDKSDFMGLELPFRYKLNLDIALKKPFTISLSMPLYSDPFFQNDFLDRTENTDWISELMDLFGTRPDTDITTTSSFSWNLNSSWKPSLPGSVKPYINSVAFSTVSNMNFSSTEDRAFPSNSVSSRRKFYYVSTATPLNANISVQGTIFQWPPASSSLKQNTPVFPVELNVPEIIAEELDTKNTETADADIDSETPVEPSLPELKYTQPVDEKIDGLKYSLTYASNPAFTSQLTYITPVSVDQINMKTPKAFQVAFKAPSDITSNLTYGGNFLSAVNKISYSPVYQEHPFFLEGETGYTDREISSYRKTDFESRSQTITNTNTFSVRPFNYTEHFRETGLSWNTTVKLLRTKFNGDIDNPDWDIQDFDLTDKDCVTTNSLSMTLAANEIDDRFKQSLSFTATMPPLEDEYKASLSLVFPFVNFTMGTGFYKKVLTYNGKNKPETFEWKKNPLTQNCSVSVPLLGKNILISENFSYNLEENHSESFRSSLSWNGLSLSYIMSYTYPYKLYIDDDPVKSRWDKLADKDFIPYSVSLNYSMPSTTIKTFKNRISIAPTLSTSINADLIKYTNSSFTFSPGIKLTLNRFLDITFSATSKNSAIATYFDSTILGYKKNIWTDLMNSFRFDSQELRKSSSFKLKSLNLNISHDLHDWKFNMNMKIEPHLVTETARQYYDFNPYITLAVVWTPMEAIKTRVNDKYGKWELE